MSAPKFEWIRKKRIGTLQSTASIFDEAATVFLDALAAESPDPIHSVGEERLIMVGRSYQDRVIVVAFTERAEKIRIISARKATKREMREYAEGY